MFLRGLFFFFVWATHNCLSDEYACTAKEGGDFPFLQLLCNLWKWNVALSPVLTINLISRWCISESFGDVVRAKSVHNFKLSFFFKSIYFFPCWLINLITFGATWTSHTNNHSGCGERELNIPSKREHTKWCWPKDMLSTWT